MTWSRLAGIGVSAVLVVAAGAVSADAKTAAPQAESRVCPPSAVALSYSDALDKVTLDDTVVGGLSGLTYDFRRDQYVAVTDNNGAEPARLWFISDLDEPRIVDSLILRRPDGTPYTGEDSDNEGLVMLEGGNYLVSSETEPSIRIFGRNGVQRGHLPVPQRFRDELHENAALEGLALSPSSRHVYAAMEGQLTGDEPADGNALSRRILVYERQDNGYVLQRQIGYRVGAGMRIAEVLAYADGRLLVLESKWVEGVGNTIKLFAVPTAGRAPDVSDIANLSAAPAGTIAPKELVADLTKCATLGAPPLEGQPQINPLMDNFEAMILTNRHAWPAQRAKLSLLVDDNFSDVEVTRLLTVRARLP